MKEYETNVYTEEKEMVTGVVRDGGGTGGEKTERKRRQRLWQLHNKNRCKQEVTRKCKSKKISKVRSNWG